MCKIQGNIVLSLASGFTDVEWTERGKKVKKKRENKSNGDKNRQQRKQYLFVHT